MMRKWNAPAGRFPDQLDEALVVAQWVGQQVRRDVAFGEVEDLAPPVPAHTNDPARPHEMLGGGFRGGPLPSEGVDRWSSGPFGSVSALRHHVDD